MLSTLQPACRTQFPFYTLVGCAGRAAVRCRLAIGLATAVCLLIVSVGLTAETDSPGPSAEPKTAATGESKLVIKRALVHFDALIGGWRGVGMPKRRSRTGIWSEKAEWIWHFKDDKVELHYHVDGGKLLKSGSLTFDPVKKLYVFHATFTDDVVRNYEGQRDRNRLSVESQPDETGIVHRITITCLNEKRTLVLHEKRRVGSRYYQRVAEVGYTRQGTRLAVEGTSGPKCIVTGGKGTIEVVHEGKTYYVCCSGCKQAFEDDPDGVIAEYRQNQASK